MLGLMSNVAGWVDRFASRDVDALVYGDDIWSARRVHDTSCRFAAGLLATGISVGSRVVLWLPNSPELVVAFTGVIRAGCVVVIVSDTSPPTEVASIVAHCRASVLVTTDRLARGNVADVRVVVCGSQSWQVLLAHAPLATPVARAADDLAQIVYTSGTTGQAKALVYRHKTIDARFRFYRDNAGEYGPATRLLCVLPLSAPAGIQALYLRLARGLTLVLVDGFDPERVLAAIAQHRVESVVLVPSMCEAMIDSTATHHDVSSLAIVRVGGATVSPSLVRRFRDRFGISISPAYGMTEVGLISQARAGDDSGSVGPIRNGMSVRIKDATSAGIGEIEVNAGAMIADYYQPDPSIPISDARPISADGWLSTGDLGYLDPVSGELYVVGRSKELVIQGGMNIYPAQVTAVLSQLPDVADCAIVGVPDQYLGEQAIACVVLRPGAQLTEDAVLAYCRSQLDARRVPARVRFVDAVPRNAFGKVKVDELRAAVTAGGEPPSTLPDHLRAVRRDQRAELIHELVVTSLLHVLAPTEGAPRAPMTPTTSFGDVGLTSIGAMRLAHTLGSLIGQALPTTLTFRFPTIGAVRDHLLEVMFPVDDEGEVVAPADLVVKDTGTAAELATRLRELLDAPDAISIRPTGSTRCRATLMQEYFWYLAKNDADSDSYANESILIFEGPLDRTALKRSVETIVGRHDIFRTSLVEVDATLFQQVSTEPRFELELEAVATSETVEVAVERAATELRASGLDLTSGRTIRGRLVSLSLDRHVLVLLVHHAVVDAASIVSLREEILDHYGRGSTAGSPVQYVDYAEALDRLARSPTGIARREWWRAKLRDAPPPELPVDVPRADTDAKRAMAPFAIVALPMHPVLSVEATDTLRAAVAGAAAAESTTPAVVYLAALIWLYHRLSGQNDISIENLYNPRAEHGVEQMQGPTAALLITRLDVSGCRTLRDLIGLTDQAVAEAFHHCPIPNYYRTVPSNLHRAFFNYIPVERRELDISGLKVTPASRPMPLFKRHWDVQLRIDDEARRTVIKWIVNAQLFRQETIRTLSDRYLELLERGLE